MAASYPSSVKSFSTKVDGTTVVSAVDVNGLQDEVVAVETNLGVNPQTTALGSTGAYSPTGTTDTVANRLKNLEAGLSASSSDGSRIGYTQLDQKTLTTSAATGSVSFTSISGSYQKLVLQIDFTSVTTTGALSLTLNNVTTGTYNYSRLVWGTTTVGTSTTDTGFAIGNPVNGTTPGYVIEIPTYARSGSGKVISSLGPSLSLTGYLATGAVTRMDLSVASSTLSATVTLFGVK